MRPLHRFAAVALILTAAVIAARVAAPSTRTAPVQYSSAACGVERWGLKTLQDAPRLLPAQTRTIAYLVSRPAPTSLPASRLPFERRVFRVTAAVTLVRPEADGDLHLVLVAGRSHMIAEAPTGGCAGKTAARLKRQMAQARTAVRLCATATVTGVAFFDFKHNQTGLAPNGIELHPILSFKCLTTPSPPPPPPPPPTTTTTTTTTTPPPSNCAASYPDECIPPPPPDLDCGQIPYRRFRVLWNVPNPDPHHFDGDRDGIGCES